MVSNGIDDLNKFDFVSGGMYPGSQINHSAYATPTQIPLGAQAVRADYDPETNPLTGEPTSRFANGGIAALHYDGTEGSQVEDPAPTEPAKPPTMSELADQLKLAYRTDTNYDDLWKQFAATKEQDPTQWYKHQLDFLGQQQGWQIGQNRSDRLAGLQPQIDNTIAEAKTAGVSDKEINSILNRSSQEGNAANQQRIATLSEVGGSGYNFSKDVRPGLGYLALATAAAATANPEIVGLGETGATGYGIGASATPTGVGSIAGGGSGVGSLGAGTLGTGVPTGLGVAEGSALAGTGAGGITALGGDAGGTLIGAGGGDAVVGGGAAYPGMSAELSAELGLTGSSSGLSTAGASGDVLANLGIETAGNGLGEITAEKALMTKMLLDSANGGGGQGGAGGSSTTTSSTPFTTNQNNPNSLQYNPNATNTIGGMSPNSPYYGYAPLTFNYESGIKPMALKAPELGYRARTYAQGGIADLGGYAAGGKLLKGPGDGMSDSIVANIGGKQPARLADGEFVIPADVVSHLGNGSTDAGAKQLYKMLDRIRHARTGNKKQGKQINPNKFLPKG
jgi:hypothetical protein